MAGIWKLPDLRMSNINSDARSLSEIRGIPGETGVEQKNIPLSRGGGKLLPRTEHTG